jgi:hypothetical protein
VKRACAAPRDEAPSGGNPNSVIKRAAAKVYHFWGKILRRSALQAKLRGIGAPSICLQAEAW